MNLESELEELKTLRTDIVQINGLSRREADKVDERISKISSRLADLKKINQE
jgi:hypothetical protein